MGDSTSEADPTSQKPHEEAHLTEVREVPTTWQTDFELGKDLRARQGATPAPTGNARTTQQRTCKNMEL